MQASQMKHLRTWLASGLLALIVTCGTLLIVLAADGLKLASPGKNSYDKGGTTINYGNSSEGYVMVKHDASKKRYKVAIKKGDNTYNYDLNSKGEYEIYPLQMGNGKYSIQVYEQVSGSKYTPVGNKTIEVKLSNKNICYLYPNQFVNYNANTKAIAKSDELCSGLSSDKEKVEAIFDFCKTEIDYHHIRAMTVPKGYLPDIDEVLKEKMGICFDYAAVMACMLRVQGIPTQLVIGFADKEYHAWNKVYMGGEWIRYDATFAATGAKPKSYTEQERY